MKAFSEQTCAKAWLKAAQHLRSTPGWRDYNIILEVKEPMRLPAGDKKVHDLMDDFLAQHADIRLSTVINTIFPASLYRRYGRAGAFEKYDEIWPTMKTHPDIVWGTYFRRMTNRAKLGEDSFNPLEKLIKKLSRQATIRSPKHAAYEIGLCEVIEGETDQDIPLYDPPTDAGRIMSGPCLSHLSFKLKEGNRLMLTALYRSHYYVHRALGNLFGLAYLQHFVAKEAGIEPAELVCVSSMAQLDTGNWKKSEVTKLIEECELALDLETNHETAPEEILS